MIFQNSLNITRGIYPKNQVISYTNSTFASSLGPGSSIVYCFMVYYFLFCSLLCTLHFSMILSRAAIGALLSSGCECWQPDSPDDMWLGNCFRRLGVPLTHSPSFHQVRVIFFFSVPNCLLFFSYTLDSNFLSSCSLT